jgi:hypothetical protein
MPDSSNEAFQSEPRGDQKSEGSVYYLFIAEKEQGPYTRGELKTKRVRREVNADTLFKRQGASQWWPLSQLRPDILCHKALAKKPVVPSPAANTFYSVADNKSATTEMPVKPSLATKAAQKVGVKVDDSLFRAMLDVDKNRI